MNREQANLFFLVIVALYEKGSLIVTSNLPFGLRSRDQNAPGESIKRNTPADSSAANANGPHTYLPNFSLPASPTVGVL